MQVRQITSLRNVAIAWAPINELHLVPQQGEAELMRMATPKRAREFYLGRHLARQASLNLGFELLSLKIAAGGEPTWPRGVVGSICHSPHTALSVVGLASSYAGLGVDIRDTREIADLEASLVASDEEFASATDIGWASDLKSARHLMFSAKEALFKCQFPLTDLRDLDFRDVTLLPDEHGEFTCQGITDHPVLKQIRILTLRLDEECVCIAYLPT